MLSQEEADSIIDTINERATEVRQLIITIGSILALLMPAVEMVGILDITPYGQGDDEWIGDDDWEWEDDFECGDGSMIEASLVNDGYKNCRDGSDEPEDEWYDCSTEEVWSEEKEEWCEENEEEEPDIVYGCTDPDALNYDEEAWEDDGSCEFEEEEETWGCTDPDAINYDPYADYDDDSCEYAEDIEDDCYVQMWDAYYDYNNETDNITIHWDADLSCDDAPHNLTVIWTLYHNDTGNWSGIQEEHTYETYYQNWDYVNITFAVPEGRYDIFSTFRFNDEYTIGTDWFDVELL